MLVTMMWGLFGSLLAVNFEFQARRGLGWVDNLWWMIPTAILVQLSVYHLMRSEMGWLPALVLFSGVATTTRIGLAFFVLHEPLNVPNLVAAGMMVVVILIRLLWR